MLVLDSITDFLLFLGKVVVVGAMAILSFFIFSGNESVFKDDTGENRETSS